MTSTALGTVPVHVAWTAPALEPNAAIGSNANAAGSGGNVVSFGLSGNAAFVPGSPSAVTSTLVAIGSGTVAGGQSLAPVAMLLREAAGHPTPNVAVSYVVGASPAAQAGELGRVVAGGTVTGSDGSLSLALASTAVGPLPLGVRAPGLQLDVVGPFVPGPADATASSWTPASQMLVADGVASAGYVLPDVVIAGAAGGTGSVDVALSSGCR